MQVDIQQGVEVNWFIYIGGFVPFFFWFMWAIHGFKGFKVEGATFWLYFWSVLAIWIWLCWKFVPR